MTIILANWKSNKNLSEAKTWLKTFIDKYTPLQGVKVIIAPPALFLSPLKQILDQHNCSEITLAAQDISPFPQGSYTGAISADMLKDLVDFVLVGHSERRRYFHETHAEIASKVEEAQVAGLTPILCLDLPYARQQIAALDLHSLDQPLIIAYGPVEAIDQGHPPASQKRQNEILAIQKICDKPILYGGSINGQNARSYIDLSEVSGLMLGSGSLDALEFAKTCTIINKATHQTTAGDEFTSNIKP